jgi:flagellar FliL protein
VFTKKKLMIVVVAVLLVAGVGYKVALAPKPKAVKKKVEGTLVSTGEAFTLNLAGGHYGRVSVALLLSEAPPVAATEGEGAAGIPQQAVVRAVITDDLTGIDAVQLIDRDARHALLARILRDLRKHTDEPVTNVLFPDLAVQ